MTTAKGFLSELTAIGTALGDSLSGDGQAFVRKSETSAPELQEALASLPTLFPEWVVGLDRYDEKRFGPLLGVSDEGSAAEVIVKAALASSKARALVAPDSAAVGVMVDGERMTSAGEVPIGPDEYKAVVGAAFGRTHCTTNVGVRVNARLYQPLPEFQVPKTESEVAAIVEKLVAAFKPFLDTPNGQPRPLTIRLSLQPEIPFDVLKALVREIETNRQSGKLAQSTVHRLSLLIVFEREIRAPEDSPRIEQALEFASQLGVPEVAVDGELLEGARKRLGVQGLLNVLEVNALRPLLAKAHLLGVRLTHRYELDPESAARTIWTGLHAARSFGMNAAKYGLIPLTLGQQETVVRLITRWTAGWPAVPAFYVDTPLLVENDVFDDTRCAAALELWMERMNSIGVKLVLVDCPDRIIPRRLVREAAADDRGVLTLAEIESLTNRSRQLGVKVLWSGGITPSQAYALARLGVSGIFSTSATARHIAVGPVLASDPQLAVENEPTELGVRRVHALIQGGFLVGALSAVDGSLSGEIERQSQKLLAALAANRDGAAELAPLDPLLVRGWQRHWNKPT